ncbi:DUF2272 domain-containing protein [Bradyrhizobium glycinis]|uniref:DUF2272 domain-containing protein n=1 Tax=Bradyrhizobium glycinis TaxID=2751812 RepID=UPI0018D8D87C|nr:DUF2272 domain-containing protein [Bradyrhizobium glycinis]MBH5370108.1 DUF2272 domain-containing protein [Bradyrhizobium glycinis]
MAGATVGKILTNQPLLKEGRDDSDQVVLNGVPLRVFAGEKVKIGAKPSTTEILGGTTITWVFVEATSGANVEQRKGFVDNQFIVDENSDIPVSGGFQPFSPRVSRDDFADACFTQAEQNATNAAYLYALAFVQSGDQWGPDEVKTNDPDGAETIGAYKFTTKTWQELLALAELRGLTADQIKFPTAQCVVAAVLASKSATLLKGLRPAHSLTAVDLYLAFIFLGAGTFGSDAAAKILDAEQAQPTQSSLDIIKQIFSDDAERNAFLSRNEAIFKQDGRATIKEALEACTAKLARGFDEVRRLAHAIKDSLPADPDSPVLDDPSSDLSGDVQAKPGNRQAIIDKLIAGAKAHGLDPMTVLTIVKIETGDFDPTDCNSVSSAAGLFQFIDETWAAEGGPTFPGRGGPGNGQAAGASVDMQVEIGCAFTVKNAKALKARLGRTITPVELYMAHQQGLGGAVKMLTANPDTAIESVIGVKAARNNGLGGLTVGQAINKLNALYQRRKNEVVALVTITPSSGAGHPGTSSGATLVLTNAVRAALDEMNTFARRGGSVVKEGEEPLRARVLEYFKFVGRGDVTDPAAVRWSAAYISFVLNAGGVTRAQFPFSASHSTYILAALANRIANRMDAPIVYFDKGEMAPRVGDLIGFSDEVQSRADIERKLPDTPFHSHTNLVVELSSSKIMAIGGNVTQSIRITNVNATPDGKIIPANKHFFVLRMNI